MITPGDVIWVYDGNIRPPGNKMYVCLCPVNGFYFRINTNGHWSGSVPIDHLHNTFLDHNSFVECNGPLEVDDYSIEESIDRDGIIGKISNEVVAAIRNQVEFSITISTADKKIILNALITET